MAKIVNIGAEATVTVTEWFGISAISKRRDVKKYRRHEIDEFIRSNRTLKEANMLNKVRERLDVPSIYFVDLRQAEIIMENVEGTKVRDVLTKSESNKAEIGKKIGEMVATLHKNHIIHGDLTTSNMIIRKNGSICLIDFGLSTTSKKLEDKGVDIRLFKGILQSAHNDVFNIVFNNFKKGYKSIMRNSTEEIFSIVKKIEMRGRYARVD
ncbi:MAG: Kae1-associated kinase Bud32 [Thaumarchaeota archaeon]|nr:Kae1-associated kinase Bud32 [Nitrososphaerota archaeon]|tara:strand:+ start:1710 stop:2339 length:630 start_codon:yes stop_codon:yes gene_type:complete